MKTNRRFHPRLDRLEDRTCPALSIHQYGGLLLVTGVPTSGSVSIQETGSNSFTVQDGSVTPASFASVSNLTMSLSRSYVSVDINLGGHTLAGTISATFAGGSNALSIENGVAGFLNIHGGIGSNDITLGDGATVFKVTRDTIVGLGGNTSDALTVADDVSLVGSLTVSNAATVTLDSGSTIGANAWFYSARAGTTVIDDAKVGADVVFIGSYVVSTGQDTLEVNGKVGLDVIYSNTWLNTAGNEIDINANVGRTVSIASGGFNDSVTVSPSVVIGGNLVVSLVRGNDAINVEDGATIRGGALFYLGAGTRTVSFGATVGNNTNALVFWLVGGLGNETVTFTAGARFLGRAVTSLSPFSANTVTFASPKAFNTYLFSIDGGAFGNNTLNLYGTGGTRLFFQHFAVVHA